MDIVTIQSNEGAVIF